MVWRRRLQGWHASPPSTDARATMYDALYGVCSCSWYTPLHMACYWYMPLHMAAIYGMLKVTRKVWVHA